MAKQFTLGKNERLKSRKLIEQLFREGKSFAVNPYRIYYKLNPDSYREKNEKLTTITNLQFGVGAGTKNFKKAVDRNRIKRLTREAWRLQNLLLKQKLAGSNNSLNVFFIYTGKELPGFTIVKEKVAVALKKLITIVDESSIENS